ncbi:hypothetical protein vBEcoMphAPEC6_02395 [Escherichia phage ph0011]|nr:hypothetical protein vBEcoMphAPEC6_02395 [Escherichia phage ph0011]
MSKYFVSYSYNVSRKIPRGDGMGWSYDAYTLNESCIIELKEKDLDILKIKQYILDVELAHRTDIYPDVNNISILVLTKV